MTLIPGIDTTSVSDNVILLVRFMCCVGVYFVKLLFICSQILAGIDLPLRLISVFNKPLIQINQNLILLPKHCLNLV